MAINNINSSEGNILPMSNKRKLKIGLLVSAIAGASALVVENPVLYSTTKNVNPESFRGAFIDYIENTIGVDIAAIESERKIVGYNDTYLSLQGSMKAVNNYYPGDTWGNGVPASVKISYGGYTYTFYPDLHRKFTHDMVPDYSN